MDPLHWFLILVCVMLLAAFTAMHRRGKLPTVPVFIALAALTYMALQDAMGRARPAELQDLPEGTQVLGFQMMEGESIEMLVQRPGEAGARALELPWSVGLAEQLQTAQREAEANGEGIGVQWPTDPAGVPIEGERVIRALPQPARPPKTP